MLNPNRWCWWFSCKSCQTLLAPWTVAHQAPLSMGILRQEYWSGLPCPLLQGIFASRDQTNPGLPHCRRILYHLSHQGSPRIMEWVAYPFSRGSSQSRNRTRVSCVAQADSVPAEPQGKPKNNGVGSLSLLQQIFPTPESNWGLLHCRWIP